MYIIWGLPHSVGLKLLDIHVSRTNPEEEEVDTLDKSKAIKKMLDETGFTKLKEENHGKQGRTKS